MKVLVNTPHLKLLGGVANHYIGLADYWNETVKYNEVGRRGVVSGIYWLPIDVIIFIWKLISFRPDIVLLNPSLSKNAIKRDQIFLRISRLFGRKIAVFFHGFNLSNVKDVDVVTLTRNLNRTVCVFVLAQEFASALRSWGVTVPIHLATTKVDDRLIDSFDVSTRSGDVRTILFLARIAENKGIFIALDTFKKILESKPHMRLKVVGDGPALNEAKRICQHNDILNVEFTGALKGMELVGAFQDSDLYFLPTYYEGMPTSVLEAMAFGLPVVTRPVGGLCDFFESGRMGQMVDSLNPDDFADAILDLIKDQEKNKEIALYNASYAKDNFMASKVAGKIEGVLKTYL